MSGLTLFASSCGGLVKRLLLEGYCGQTWVGRVIALYDRSILIKLPMMHVSLVEPTLGAGPFSISFSTSDEFRELKVRAYLGQTVSFHQSSVASNVWAVDLTGATIWERNVNEYSDRQPSVSNISGRLEQLIEIAPENTLFRCCNRGVASQTRGRAAAMSMDQAIDSYLINVLKDSEDAFRRALEHSSGLPPELFGLLGAGKGLTPTGDDVLVGILLSLNMLDQLDTSKPWLIALSEATKVSTQPFSAQFVLGACHGYVGERLNKLFDQIVVAPRFDALETATLAQSIGHSSGWDTLVGLHYVCRIMASVEHSCRQTAVVASCRCSAGVNAGVSAGGGQSNVKINNGISHA